MRALIRLFRLAFGPSSNWGTMRERVQKLDSGEVSKLARAANRLDTMARSEQVRRNRESGNE